MLFVAAIAIGLALAVRGREADAPVRAPGTNTVLSAAEGPAAVSDLGEPLQERAPRRDLPIAPPPGYEAACAGTGRYSNWTSFLADANLQFVCLDLPRDGAVVGRELTIRGWACCRPDGGIAIELRQERSGARLVQRGVAGGLPAQYGEGLGPFEVVLVVPPAFVAGLLTVVVGHPGGGPVAINLPFDTVSVALQP